mmetsp:Transcript_82765/g.210604  ORF Transcript_82765/g.210604 Transcript_82765/m.210604 type:complete len:460 (-) Transcript_82765:62-1441(-)
MRIILQRVSRATVQVNGVVESRIGSGVLLTLAVRSGDTVESARQLAAKVLKLHLFPDLMDEDAVHRTNVVDNGFEVLVMLQQTLHATFPKLFPNQDACAGAAEAKKIFDAFVEKLKSEYQDEMVAVTPPGATGMQLEMTCAGGGIFELGAGDSNSAPAPAATKASAKAGPSQAPGTGAAATSLPALGVVTKALRRLPGLKRARATIESSRVLRILKLPKFQAAFGESPQDEIDAFAEALEASAHVFTEAEQEEVMALTGLYISAPPAPRTPPGGPGGGDDWDAGPAPRTPPGEDDDLEAQLAQLQGEVADPMKGIAAAKQRRAGQQVPVKEEAQDGGEDARSRGPRSRPDWNGRAAPETPATNSAQHWVATSRAGKGKGGKGGGPRPMRSLGIVSVNDATRLHGNRTGPYQHRPGYTPAKQEPGAEGGMRESGGAPRLPKGMPTVAPMCPAGTSAEEDL